MAELYGENVRQKIDQIKASIDATREIKDITEKIQNDMEMQITSYALSLKTSKFKREELDAFFKQPYTIDQHPKLKDTWLLRIPKFVDAAFGWLETTTPSYNVFAVNRYMDWLGELPGEVKRAIGMKDAPALKLFGDTLTGPKTALKQAWEKYPKGLFKAFDEKGIIVNPKRTFELLQALVADGILPFTSRPVDKNDIVDPPKVKPGFEPREYQLDAWKKFLQYSNVGIFFPPNIGKTWQAMWTMASLKGPHLVVVPSKILQDQWRDRLELHTDLKEGVDFTVVTYFTAVKRYSDGMMVNGKIEPWSLLCVDECQHIPADEFSKLALVKRKYTLGLSATPYREDGRESFIFAFTGFPVGMSWDYFRKLGLLKKPVCHIWLVKSPDRKLARLKELLKDEKKTLVFSDGIELGKSIAARFSIPHVSGETKENRMDLIAEGFAKAPFAVVISRVGDEGISLPGIERIIEVDWLGRSRRQELQRHTRLLHGRQEGVEGENHILMTLDEYRRDHQRLYSLMDKGFAVKVNSDEINERELERTKESPYLRGPSRRTQQVPPSKEDGASPPSDASTVGIGSEKGSSLGSTGGLIALAGVQKLMGSLTGPQRKLYEILLGNDGSWFKASKLPMLLGYPPLPSSINRLRDTVHINELVRRGLIEKGKIDGEICYKTNVRSQM